MMAGDAHAVTLLHRFSNTGESGGPYGTLALSGSTFYGITAGGTIFSVGADGTSYGVLHNLSSGEGQLIYGSVTLSGSKLYGMASHGGASGYGSIFSMNTDGTGFSVLRSFSSSGAYWPYGSLTASGSKLYGMTSAGSGGKLFSMNTDGSGYAILHGFTGESTNGGSPFGSLTLSGSTLYGMTSSGGSAGLGTIFSVNTDGSGFGLVHSFTGGDSDGRSPNGSLTLSGSTLYGMTYKGGSSNTGTVFSVNTDGSGFSLLHTFTGGSGDGALPMGKLTLSGTTLYGMTLGGGSSDYGTMFSMGIDGSDYSLLYNFAGGTNDGRQPRGGLTLYDSSLYGMTTYGGISNPLPPGNGVVFSLQLALAPEPSSFVLSALGLGGLAAARRRRSVGGV